VISTWMLFALAVSALMTVAAFAAERVLKAYGRPTRFVWLSAIALSVLWPVAPTIARLLPAPPKPVNVLPFTIVLSAPSVISADEAAAIRRALFVDRALMLVWVGLSLLLLARLVRGALALEESRRKWKRGRVNGTPVKVSENVGPAVVGLRTMDVVVPEWIFSLDEHLRAIVLCHEEEHREARDPLLLFAATVLVALMPWNVALWIQARRLRLAIEMDCDARVLRVHPSPERYGMLILTIAQRRSLAPVQFAPMLSEPKTNLERRILAMRTTKVARLTVIGGGLVTTGVLALASALQSAPTSFEQTRTALAQRFVAALPGAFAPETIPVKKKSVSADSVARNATPSGANEVRKLNAVITTGATPSGQVYVDPAYLNMPPAYPAVLRATQTEGAVIARFTYDAHGTVDPASISVVTSTDGTLTESVRSTVARWRGAPNTTLQIPFIFVIDTKTGKDLAAYPGGLPEGSMVVRATAIPVESVVGNGPLPVNADQTYFEFQVEKPVQSLPGNPGPRYPDELRAANVEGEVLAQFVVGPDGVADMSTFKVLKSNHDLFTEAVVKALPNMKFSPPEVGGRAVKQLVQMPFQFNLSKTP
jgi:TonB family protein